MESSTETAKDEGKKRMVLETKDFVTMGLSIAAIAISIGALSVAYWQYQLNYNRDVREQQSRIDDRTPVVTIVATRDGQMRQFNVKFDIKNRPLSTVALDSVELLDSKYELVPSSEGPRFKTSHVYPTAIPNMQKVRFEPNEIEVNERFTWNLVVRVPDPIGIEYGKAVRFLIAFRVHDNADTPLIITRALTLN